MANEENLIPFDKRTENEQREIAKKGGIESGRTRRRNKQLKTLIKSFMCRAPSNEKDIKRLKEAGFTEDEWTNESLMLLKVLTQVNKGNMRAIEFVRDMLGENPYFELKKEELKLKREAFELKKKMAEEGKNITSLAVPVVLVDDVRQ